MTLTVDRKVLVASLALAIGFSAPAAAQQVDTTVTANLVLQVQELQDEVRNLRGQLEEAKVEIENLKRRQRDQYLDLDQRISDLRNAQPVAPGQTAAVPPPATATRQPEVSPSAGDVPEVRAPMDTPSDTLGIGEPDVQSQAAPTSAADEKAAYDRAFQALKELRYADAAEEFRAFLDRYPDSAKVPDALLKIGYTHYELKQWDEARAALTQVQADYPDTTLARLAENRLRSMRMEGHY